MSIITYTTDLMSAVSFYIILWSDNNTKILDFLPFYMLLLPQVDAFIKLCGYVAPESLYTYYADL